MDGTFKGGVMVGTLADGGVGLAPFHDLESRFRRTQGRARRIARASWTDDLGGKAEIMSTARRAIDAAGQ